MCWMILPALLHDLICLDHNTRDLTFQAPLSLVQLKHPSKLTVTQQMTLMPNQDSWIIQQMKLETILLKFFIMMIPETSRWASSFQCHKRHDSHPPLEAWPLGAASCPLVASLVVASLGEAYLLVVASLEEELLQPHSTHVRPAMPSEYYVHESNLSTWLQCMWVRHTIYTRMLWWKREKFVCQVHHAVCCGWWHSFAFYCDEWTFNNAMCTATLTSSRHASCCHAWHASWTTRRHFWPSSGPHYCWSLHL